MDTGSHVIKLMESLISIGISVQTGCIFWKPVKILCRPLSKGGEDEPLSEENVLIGRAVNQYFVQRLLSRTNNSNVWLCCDVLSKELCCLKEYDINACIRERSIRCNGEDVEVVNILDKVVDEIIYHASVTSLPGVAKLREIIISVKNNTLFMVMDYYPSQLLYYDTRYGIYRSCFRRQHTPPTSDDGHCITQLYKEEWAKAIMRDLLQTTKQLHKMGIVHKDLKPENILLKHTQPSMYDVVKIPVCRDQVSESASAYSYSGTENICWAANEIEAVNICLKGVSASPYAKMDVIEAPTKHFPYQPDVDECLTWVTWDQCPVVCDTVPDDSEGNDAIKIGSNVMDYAVALVKSLQESSSTVFDYFLRGEKSIKYSANPLFLPAAKALADNHCIAESAGSGASMDHLMPSATAFITDFSVSNIGIPVALQEDLLIYDAEGTAVFTSPECLKHTEGGVSGKKRDIYSLGVVLYVMIYGQTPYKGRGSIELLINILESPLVFHEYRAISRDLQDLLSCMLEKDCKRRYDADTALKHPWFDRS